MRVEDLSNIEWFEPFDNEVIGCTIAIKDKKDGSIRVYGIDDGRLVELKNN